MIRWSDVVVSYGNGAVVGPVSLAVVDGEWLGLIGPNGAGKSTLLRTAVGLVEYLGTVDIGQDRRVAGRDIAWLPQRPHLPEEMSVSDYVLLGRTPHIGYLGSESPSDMAAAAGAIDRLGLELLSTRRLATLSGGEAQRVVLARALAQEANVLLLDEPTANLDVGHAVEVLETLDSLRRDEGLTVVTAIHDLTLAGRFADRLALLAGGALISDGSPADVLTEDRLIRHYGDGIRVESHSDGPAVIPTRRQHG